MTGRVRAGRRAVPSSRNAEPRREGPDFWQAVVLGILCNVLVCLAVWLTYSARTTADRILAIVIGGALLVGGVYWFVYLRPPREP